MRNPPPQQLQALFGSTAGKDVGSPETASTPSEEQVRRRRNTSHSCAAREQGATNRKPASAHRAQRKVETESHGRKNRTTRPVQTSKRNVALRRSRLATRRRKRARFQQGPQDDKEQDELWKSISDNANKQEEKARDDRAAQKRIQHCQEKDNL